MRSVAPYGGLIGGASTRKEKPISRSPRNGPFTTTKGTGAIRLIPQGTDTPNTSPVPTSQVRQGSHLGFLRVLRVTSGEVAAICSCGARTWPLLRDVARGAMRSCGNATVHGDGVLTHA